MDNNPLVSICVPIYGVENYIERCVRSLFDQTYERIEYVFVDDCTPDRSISIIQQVMQEYPKRAPHVIIVHHSTNSGLAVARNTGVANATGDFIMWVDGDDFIDVHTLEKVVRKQSETDADIVCFDDLMLFKDHSEPDLKNRDYSNNIDFILKMLNVTVSHGIWGHLIRRSLYIDNGVKVEAGVNMSEDLQAMVLLAWYAKRVVTLHEPLYFYDRSRETSYTNEFRENYIRQTLRTFEILEHFFKDKNAEIETALLCAHADSLAFNMRLTVDQKGYKYLYYQLKKALENIDRKYWKTMSNSTTIAMKFRKSYYLLHIYNLIVGFTKRTKK